MNMMHKFLPLLFLCILAPKECPGCTVLCFARDGLVLGGNNEDWEDPFTRMWIYPPSGNRHGWIKFGFAGGFPQGGMNDQGVFWDATAGPYREMPWSEAHKTLHGGVLMQKVIEECSSVKDAIWIFSNYYSKDQYRAQYLVGDALGFSIVSDGDSIVAREGDYQILTNFHLSDPDLGGYPCPRYQKAEELCASCDTLTYHFMGTVLASTRQEGRYPTRYSIIYDLVNRRVILFYYHNYEEYLVIDLVSELEKGERYYDIPALFSRVTPVGPLPGEQLPGDSAVISWTGLPDSQYRVVYSTSPDLTDPVSVLAGTGSAGITGSRADREGRAAAGVLLLLLFAGLLTRGKQTGWGTLLLLLALMIGTGCREDEEVEDPDPSISYSVTLQSLDKNTPYYWKIEAEPGVPTGFITETAIRSFHTGG